MDGVPYGLQLIEGEWPAALDRLCDLALRVGVFVVRTVRVHEELRRARAAVAFPAQPTPLGNRKMDLRRPLDSVRVRVRVLVAKRGREDGRQTGVRSR